MTRHHTPTQEPYIVVPEGALDGVDLRALANGAPVFSLPQPRNLPQVRHGQALRVTRDRGHVLSDSQWRERARWIEAQVTSPWRRYYSPSWDALHAAANAWEREHGRRG